MSSSDHDDEPQVKRGKPASPDGWRQRRRVDDVFGTDLPDVTSDESDEDHNSLSREWYESNRPPHYE